MAKFEAGMEAMADMYVFETTSLLEQLDQILMKTENESSFAEEDINEIFRTMHTIKGSSAMMGLENMSKLAHAIEDMFYIIREDHPVISSMETLYDIIFSASDLLKAEIENLQEDEYTPTDFTEQMTKIEDYAAVLKGAAPADGAAAAETPAASSGADAPAPAAPAAAAAQAAAPVSGSGLTTVKVFFEDDCKMENLRALLVINRISESCAELEYIPDDIENNGDTAKTIIKDGFLVKFRPAPGSSTDGIMETIRTTANVKSCDIIERGSEAAASTADAVTTVRVHFDDDCKMENLRALLVVNNVRDVCENVTFEPADIEDNAETSRLIVEEGFVVRFKSDKPQMVLQVIEGTPSVKSYVVEESPEQAPAAAAPKDAAPVQAPAQTAQAAPSAQSAAAKKAEAPKPAAKKAEAPKPAADNGAAGAAKGGVKQSLISVNLNKLDVLLDLVGEIVITEAMVTSNPDLKGLKLDNFQKSARQLRKLNSELQDAVMSMRMVPISGAFNKMTRIVRDMKVKLGKDVELIFEGEDTEVDKSIIDQLNDPLMHMVRNSMDHGIEDNVEDRIAAGKSPKGKITLSAYNASGEVIIVIADDGQGIDPEKVLAKAERNGILTKSASEYSEKEILNMIMLPGFSTNEQVTEYSGRGVGMDVVKKNIEKIGGSVSVDSKFGQGSNFVIKIPLSLSIVDGMEISVGNSIFTIPINSIRNSFKVQPSQLVKDTTGKEMVMVYGECYPLIRLYQLYDLKPNTENVFDGIVILVETDGKSACIFADELIGEQQVVLKPFPSLLGNYNIKQYGMSGCSILGDGSITIIIDVSNVISDF
ncbi:MAG: chemotaxis protein CheA [Oscillospiraceae bacterium]|jgi:two-component system chemotaxis sensor kinase CheA|nr:chemotaxis protein CheA [Oscillospiraceae bacterium]